MSDTPQLVLLTHFDLDGIGCAVLMQHAYDPDVVEFHGHTSIAEATVRYLEAGASVFCTDIAPKRDVILGLTPEQRSRLLIIDHHAKGPLGDGPIEGVQSVYDSTVCATELVFAYVRDVLESMFHEDKAALGLLVAVISTRDLWKRDSLLWDMATDLQTLMKLLGLDEMRDRLMEDANPKLDTHESFAVSIAQEQEQKYITGRVATVALDTDSEGRTFGWTHATHCFSEVCHGTLTRHPEAEYAVAYDANEGRVELRSREGGPHVGEIAAKRGGGGHPCASGYSVMVSGLPMG